jgi:hypothetical protein
VEENRTSYSWEWVLRRAQSRKNVTRTMMLKIRRTWWSVIGLQRRFGGEIVNLAGLSHRRTKEQSKMNLIILSYRFLSVIPRKSGYFHCVLLSYTVSSRPVELVWTCEIASPFTSLSDPVALHPEGPGTIKELRSPSLVGS